MTSPSGRERQRGGQDDVSHQYDTPLARRTVLAGGIALTILTFGCTSVAVPVDYEALIDSLSNVLIPASSLEKPGLFLVDKFPAGFLGLTRADVDLVGQEVDRRANGSFVTLPAERQADIVATMDKENDPAAAWHSPWTKMKTALVSLYFSSETGASKDLVYDLVPGRYEPDVPLASHPIPLSNDMFARSSL